MTQNTAAALRLSLDSFSLMVIARRFVESVVLSASGHYATISGYNNQTGVDNTPVLMDKLQSYGFTVVPGFGSWEGKQEASLFVVPRPRSSYGTSEWTEDDIAYLNQLAAEFGQECWLMVQGNGDGAPGASLNYPDAERAFTGTGGRREYFPKVDGRNNIFTDIVGRGERGFSEYAGFAFSIES